MVPEWFDDVVKVIQLEEELDWSQIDPSHGQPTHVSNWDFCPLSERSQAKLNNHADFVEIPVSNFEESGILAVRGSLKAYIILRRIGASRAEGPNDLLRFLLEFSSTTFAGRS